MSMIETRKTNTGKFLEEFKILQKLSSIPDDDEGACPAADRKRLAEMAGEAVHPFDPLVEDGDLRLFSQTDNITYGAVLPWDKLSALVVPLSHYAHPADETELYAEDAENNGLFRKVYQIWNARTIQKSLLSRTWKVGSISAAEQKRLKQMLRHSLLGEAIPEELLPHIGITDDRLRRLISEYRSGELENFSALDAEDMQLETALDELPEFDFQPIRREFEAVMAAAGRETLSPVYLRKGKKWTYLDAIEAENFRRVKAGTALPLFSWFTEAIKPELNWRVVAFRETGSHVLLGAGVIEPENDGAAIRLRYPVDKQEIPELRSPADIEIIILEP